MTERLPEIHAPALVVHGAIDPAIPLDRAQALCSGLPKCEGLELIPGAGHAANLSHPDRVNELLEAFCARHLFPSSREVTHKVTGYQSATD